MLTFEINYLDHCRRLESFLRTLLPKAAPGYARKLIKSGAAKCNGLPAAADTLLALHDTVTLKESAATLSHLSPSRPALDILSEDDSILIANKPNGLAMHRTAECETNLVELGQSYLAERGSPCKLYPVNRLDRGTSGTVILAKSSSAAAVYGRQVKETGLDKLYLALVWGTPPPDGIITEPLDEKESETRYRLLLAGENCALLAVTPISGRMHQIRRHLASIGRPVMGDKRYGGGELPELTGFALHSFRTSLTREDGSTLTVSAPLPDELLQLCERRGIGVDRLMETLYHVARSKLIVQEET